VAETAPTQSEADALPAAEKHRAADTSNDYPVPGGALFIPLVSVDHRENLLLDVCCRVVSGARRPLGDTPGLLAVL